MRVSAIMPTKNRADCIGMAIACFLSQTVTDSELLILDDGSDDTTFKIPADPRIRYRCCKPTMLGEKRNLCCEAAQAPVIMHFDDDDWSAPGRMEDQLRRLEDSTKQVTGYHSLLWYDETERKAYRYKHPSTGPYAIGTSLCYFKNWWAKYPFNAKKRVGEDNEFGEVARDKRAMISADAGQLMVARKHAKSTSHCTMGGFTFPKVDINEIPKAFFDDLSASRNRNAGATG
jgi:glycosyltransferase involved in cell wall biosynthesis